MQWLDSVKNLTLLNKNLTLLSNVTFSTLFQPITKNISGLFLPRFLFSFGGLKKYLCHYSLYSYCSTNWQIKFKKAQLLSHALDFMVWHVSLWALSCLSWVFYWVFGYIVESEVEKLIPFIWNLSQNFHLFLMEIWLW